MACVLLTKEMAPTFRQGVDPFIPSGPMREGEWVYIIESSSAFKVGYSANPERRLATLKTANPEIVEMVAKCPGSRVLEASMHSLCSKSRLEGEWFAKDKSLHLLIYVVSLLNIAFTKTMLTYRHIVSLMAVGGRHERRQNLTREEVFQIILREAHFYVAHSDKAKPPSFSSFFCACGHFDSQAFTSDTHPELFVFLVDECFACGDEGLPLVHSAIQEYEMFTRRRRLFSKDPRGVIYAAARSR